jgi:predicted GIY-YIG superfamily endonuclease
MAQYIFITTNEENDIFLVGLCSNIAKKVIEIKHSETGKIAEFNARKLVYIETYKSYDDAIRREKEIKSWDNEYLKQIISFNNRFFEDRSNDII